MRTKLLAVLCCGAFSASFSLTATAVFAGGGPENVLLVVNAQSDASKTIANEYIRLRQIPASNVVYLADVPNEEVIDVDTFREKILNPVLDQLGPRGLGAQIDYVVYSADFPTGIQIQKDLEKLGDELPKVLTTTASINSLTFFAGLTLQKNPNYLQLNGNWYARQNAQQVLQNAVVGETAEQFQKMKQHFADKDYQAAVKLIDELLKSHSRQAALHYWLARCQAALENHDAAIASLQEAVKSGWSFREFTKQDAAFEKLQDNERFKAVLESIEASDLPLSYSRGFRSQYVWAPNGMRVDSLNSGSRFLLSTVLAVTRGAGTTVDEALLYLRRSAEADGTRPQGKFYFTLTGDIRTRTREPGFAETIAELKRLGYESEIVQDTLPKDRADVVGATIGAASFDWASAHCSIMPGAICENLTSFGGVMTAGSGQTALSEFLKHGAAGSSGTVTEPYAIQAKFPHPSIHVHYVRGCSLAEAFYQSVSGPYQLLIVGDPLCQPWADPPKFDFIGLQAGQEVQGRVESAPFAGEQESKIAGYEIFIDGIRRGILNTKQPFNFESRELTDGFHELRIVAIDNTPIETQSRKIIPFFVNNHDQRLALEIVGTDQVDLDGQVELQAAANVGDSISIMHNSRELAKIEGKEGKATISCRELGAGVVELQAVTLHENRAILSKPIKLNVMPKGPQKGIGNSSSE